MKSSFWFRMAIYRSTWSRCIFSSISLWEYSDSIFFSLNSLPSSSACRASLSPFSSSFPDSCSCPFSVSCRSSSARRVLSCCWVSELSSAALASREPSSLRICCSRLARRSSKDLRPVSHSVRKESEELISSSIRLPRSSFSSPSSLLSPSILACSRSRSSVMCPISLSLRKTWFLQLLIQNCFTHSASCTASSASISRFRNSSNSISAVSLARSSPSSFSRRSFSSATSAWDRSSESYWFCRAISSVLDSRMASLSEERFFSCLCFSSFCCSSWVSRSNSSLSLVLSWSLRFLRFLKRTREQSENFFMMVSRPVWISSLQGHFLRQYSQNISNSLASSPILFISPPLSRLSTVSNSFLMKALVSCAFLTRISSSTPPISLSTSPWIQGWNSLAWSFPLVLAAKSCLRDQRRASFLSARSFLVEGVATSSLATASSAWSQRRAMACSHSRAQTYFQPVSI